MAGRDLTPEEEEREKKLFVSAVIRATEERLVEYERRILAGDEDAADKAHNARVWIEHLRNPPKPPPPPPKMTTKEYFEKYGMPAIGRA